MESEIKRKQYVEVMGGARKNSATNHEGDTAHISIAVKMIDDLEMGPAYSLKSDLLKTACAFDITMLGDSIRWDFIVRSVEDSSEAGLIMPFSKNFLAPITEDQLLKMGFAPDEAERYAAKTLREALIRSQEIVEVTGDYTQGLKLAGRALLGGQSKSVVGFASVKSCNSMLFLHRLQTKANITMGTRKAHDDLLALGRDRGLELPVNNYVQLT